MALRKRFITREIKRTHVPVKMYDKASGSVVDTAIELPGDFTEKEVKINDLRKALAEIDPDAVLVDFVKDKMEVTSDVYRMEEDVFIGMAEIVTKEPVDADTEC